LNDITASQPALLHHTRIYAPLHEAREKLLGSYPQGSAPPWAIIYRPFRALTCYCDSMKFFKRFFQRHQI
jgi:hypothetical protein